MSNKWTIVIETATDIDSLVENIIQSGEEFSFYLIRHINKKIGKNDFTENCYKYFEAEMKKEEKKNE